MNGERPVMNRNSLTLGLLVLLAILAACAAPPAADGDTGAAHTEGHDSSSAVASMEIALETATIEGFRFIGDGGEIDGLANPELRVPAGATIGVTVTNGDGVEHDFNIEELGVHSEHLTEKGESTRVTFTAETPGTYTYFCTVPGHREAGMEGVLMVQ